MQLGSHYTPVISRHFPYLMGARCEAVCSLCYGHLSVLRVSRQVSVGLFCQSVYCHRDGQQPSGSHTFFSEPCEGHGGPLTWGPASQPSGDFRWTCVVQRKLKARKRCLDKRSVVSNLDISKGSLQVRLQNFGTWCLAPCRSVPLSVLLMVPAKEWAEATLRGAGRGTTAKVSRSAIQYRA
jgi:hypothetical protein